jgi:hypothetical protein
MPNFLTTVVTSVAVALIESLVRHLVMRVLQPAS